MAMNIQEIQLAIEIGILFTIAYTLKVLVLLDRKLGKLLERQGLKE